jgi:hypothetical protein
MVLEANTDRKPGCHDRQHDLVHIVVSHFEISVVTISDAPNPLLIARFQWGLLIQRKFTARVVVKRYHWLVGCPPGSAVIFWQRRTRYGLGAASAMVRHTLVHLQGWPIMVNLLLSTPRA